MFSTYRKFVSGIGVSFCTSPRPHHTGKVLQSNEKKKAPFDEHLEHSSRGKPFHVKALPESIN